MFLLVGYKTNGDQFFQRCNNVHMVRSKVIDCILDNDVVTTSLRVVQTRDMMEMTMGIWEVAYDE